MTLVRTLGVLWRFEIISSPSTNFILPSKIRCIATITSLRNFGETLLEMAPYRLFMVLI